MISANKFAAVGAGTKNAAIGIGLLLAIGGVAWLAWKTYQGAAAAVDTAEDILSHELNPASDENLIYTGVNSAIGCGGGSCSLGTLIYDLFNP